MNLPVYYLRMRKSMNSKIIFWFLKKLMGTANHRLGQKSESSSRVRL